MVLKDFNLSIRVSHLAFTESKSGVLTSEIGKYASTPIKSSDDQNGTFSILSQFSA